MTPPFHIHERGPLYRLQGTDSSMLGASPLYLAGGPGAAVSPLPIAMLADEWLGSGTFRNSLYIDPWAQLSHARDLWLLVEAQGSLRVRVMRAALGSPAEVIREFRIDAPQPTRFAHWIGEFSDIQPGSRLFWHVDAVDGAVLHEVTWCTRSRPREGMRLAVLLRTWGRGADLRSLLHRLADSAAQDASHGHCLNQIDFWVLDSTPGASADWEGLAAKLNLNLRLFTAPNLGGGGNISHLLSLFLQSPSEEQASADELLILDDDLNISMESLARYFTLCAYRTKDVVCSLPILMKSRPTQIWEDGGFWGRRGFDDIGDGIRERSLAPHLVRHGLQLDGFAHLDEFGPLNRCEYTTFIFFGLPLRALQKIGLPAAFFLRGDDVELSMRAAAAGIPVLTNPNLAAWHEPAHSHAQEYMAILHGMIINLAYTQDEVETYAGWFEQRLLEHASLGDEDGLRVYRLVLEDLLNADSALLTPAFESHYPARLAAWPRGQLHPLPTEARERLNRDPATRLLPFLYPGVHPQATRLGVRLLQHDAAAQNYWAVSPRTVAQRLAMMQAFGEVLLRFCSEFPALQARWRERLQASGQINFWAQVAQRHQDQTQLVAVHRRLAPSEPEARAPGQVTPASAPARELRERLERELASISQLRRHVLEQRGPANPDYSAAAKRWWKRWWSPGSTRKASQKSEPAVQALPPDFDPQVYLSLHLDVARTGMDPARHYLQFGRKEGRRYRL